MPLVKESMPLSDLSYHGQNSLSDRGNEAGGRTITKIRNNAHK